jgi:hypothetical protein
MILSENRQHFSGSCAGALDAVGRRRINAAAMTQIAITFSARRRRPFRAALAFDRI